MCNIGGIHHSICRVESRVTSLELKKTLLIFIPANGVAKVQLLQLLIERSEVRILPNRKVCSSAVERKISVLIYPPKNI